MVFSHYAYETPSMGIAVIYRTALGGRMGMLEKRVNVVCGHYGVGKTNLSINLAVDCARDGEEVTLIDMDVVNPYFRSADYAEELEGLGVRVIGPNYASTNLDTPSLPASLPAAIEDGGRVIIVPLPHHRAYGGRLGDGGGPAGLRTQSHMHSQQLPPEGRDHSRDGGGIGPVRRGGLQDHGSPAEVHGGAQRGPPVK